LWLVYNDIFMLCNRNITAICYHWHRKRTELIAMVELNEKKNKKRRVFIGLIFLFLFLGGICSAFQVLQVGDQMVYSDLVLSGEEIKINPGENQITAVESMAVTYSGSSSAPESSGKLLNESFDVALLPMSDFGQFNFLTLLAPISDDLGELVEREKPEEPLVIEPEEVKNEENSDNDNEESREAEQENIEEPQPEEPVYERTVYNFGDSEQFNLTRNVTQEDFDADFIVKQNSFEINEDGSGLSPEKGGEGRFFNSNSYLNYFVKIVAALNESTPDSEGQPRNDGGYAVMFETTLDSNNNDAGFALQFDRGYGNGEIVIRTREIRLNSKEEPQTYENTPAFRYKELPNKNDNPEWWTAEHQLELRVNGLEDESTEGTNKSLSVYLDDEHLFDWDFMSEIEDVDDNHVGLRVWHESSKNVEIIGLEIGELPATAATEPALPEHSATGSAQPEGSSEPEVVNETE